MIKYIFILSFFLFQLPVYSSLGVADLCIFLLNIFYIVSLKIKFPKTLYKNLMIALFIWLLMTPFLVNDYDVSFFLNRILRLFNLFFGVLIIPSIISRNKKDFLKAIKFLCIICGMLFILTIIEFIFLQFNFNFDIRLLNRDFLKITQKPYSIYSEPSILAIVLVISNYIIFYAKKIFNKSISFFNIFILLNSISIFLTFTVSGLIGLLVFLFLTLKTRKKIYLISSFLVLSVLIDFNVGMVNKNITERIEKIINSEDNSANQRLIGSWTVPFLFLDNNIVGAGTGQEIIFFEKINLNGVVNFSQFNTKINNSLALIFLENGFIGLFIFILLILSFYKTYKLLPVVIMYYSFTHGTYFSAVLWCSIMLFISLSLIQKSDKSAKI